MSAKDCTPPGHQQPGPRRSKASRWRIATLLLVHLLFAVHLVHWMQTGKTLGLVEPSEAMEFTKAGVVNVGLVFFVLTIASTLLLGRFFCGWACHVVALQDASRWLLLKVGIRPRPLRSRTLVWMPALAAFYLFFWPAVYRGWLSWKGTPAYIETTEHYMVQDFWATMPGLWVGVVTLFTAGFACVYFLGAKGFCTYGCPYGAVFGLVDRVSPGRIRVTDACEGCGHCSQTCTSNVAVAREVRDYGMVVDPGCMKCMDCVSVCPKDALYFGFGAPALGAKPRREPAAGPKPLPWSEELVLLGVFLATFFTIKGVDELAFGQLYNVVPLLFAMGVSSVVAFGALKVFQLFRRDQVHFLGAALKTGEGWTGRGRSFAGVGLVVFALWAHSAWMQFEARQVRGAFRDHLEAVRDGWWGAGKTLTDAQEAAARDVLVHGTRVLEHGLITDPVIAIEVGWAALFLGDEERFEREMQRALERDPRSGNAALLLGLRDETAGELEAAIDHYQEAVDRDPDLRLAWSRLIRAHTQRGTGDEAIKALVQGQQVRPAMGFLYANQAELMMRAGDETDALPLFEKALVLEPTMHPVRLILSQNYYAPAGKLGAALQVLNDGIEVHPTYYPFHEARLLILESSGREGEKAQALRDMVEAFETKLARAPLDVALRELMLRKVYFVAGDPAAALVCAQEGIELLPDVPVFYIAAVQMLVNLERRPEAEAVARAGLERFPDDASFEGQLGASGLDLEKVRTQPGE